MKALLVLLSIAVTIGSFCFYMLGLMHLSPLIISGFVFFISLVITIRLITYRKKPTI
ncbi:hypothetical protein ACFO4N_15575 [Camelliibacillus cellulosilyticus]|uniref:Uncharacterized protein n=1 Tax=Camelliibacillus cellulosilyticus TaxID=2174486 RepID=A0ABV9GT45_9BACL